MNEKSSCPVLRGLEGSNALRLPGVERHATCIYSQLKTVSSSEVAAMIKGVLRHCTQMTIEKLFVDTHGQNEVAFGFCHLLGFQLMPRLKNIYAQRLARPKTGEPEAYPNRQAHSFSPDRLGSHHRAVRSDDQVH